MDKQGALEFLADKMQDAIESAGYEGWQADVYAEECARIAAEFAERLARIREGQVVYAMALTMDTYTEYQKNPTPLPWQKAAEETQ